MSVPPTTPVQKILFGSPGTGKSHRVDNEIAKDLSNPEIIKTVFHPEYTYGDFMGKLMPLTDEQGKVSYRYYLGHFMQALAKAYKFYLEFQNSTESEKPNQPLQNVLLVIDEINRGNSAAIFGTAFQLLDREDDGWSSYAVNISDMEKISFLKELGYHRSKKNAETYGTIDSNKDITNDKPLDQLFTDKMSFLANGQIKLPPNLSIVGTMNTSDESIYYMDSAFKRRWSWEYVDTKYGAENLADVNLVYEQGTVNWTGFVDKLNEFILSKPNSIRKVEDKQIGYYFIKAKDGKIQASDIQNKLMFFLWDTVFARDKEPLKDLLKSTEQLVTFGDFNKKVDTFIEKVKKYPTEEVKENSPKQS